MKISSAALERAVTPCVSQAPAGIGDFIARLLVRHPDLGPVEQEMRSAFQLLGSTFDSGAKVLTCGNGGSAADGEHIVGELMKAMVVPRPLHSQRREALRLVVPAELGEYLAEHLEGALPAISLGAQSALLTAIDNDIAGDMVFAQQVYGYGRSGDLLWALSTSGRSRNVVLAAATARAVGMTVLAFTGPSESPLGDMADVRVVVPASTVAHIQELHLAVYHTLCEALERRFFGGDAPSAHEKMEGSRRAPLDRESASRVGDRADRRKGE